MPQPTTPKVSIIIPVYNAGEFLHPCLQSLMAQTLKEIEIIAVLDCPTDGSDQVVKSYAARDPRIRVIENERNLRVGLSRNRGIEAARGEYVGFCDHDDYVEPDMCECLYRAAQRHEADMVICNINCRNADGTLRKIIRYPDLEPDALREHVLEVALRFYAPEDPGYGKYIWNICFSRSFLGKHHLRFGDNTVITSDDALFLSKACFLARKMVHCGVERGLCNHVGHTGSTEGTYNFLNIPLIVHYLIDLHAFLLAHNATSRQWLYTAEGTVRHLYTGFRREEKFKGFRYALNRPAWQGVTRWCTTSLPLTVRGTGRCRPSKACRPLSWPSPACCNWRD